VNKVMRAMETAERRARNQPTVLLPNDMAVSVAVAYRANPPPVLVNDNGVKYAINFYSFMEAQLKGVKK
jgi:hypothetical protein